MFAVVHDAEAEREDRFKAPRRSTDAATADQGVAPKQSYRFASTFRKSRFLDKQQKDREAARRRRAWLRRQHEEGAGLESQALTGFAGMTVQSLASNRGKKSQISGVELITGGENIEKSGELMFDVGLYIPGDLFGEKSVLRGTVNHTTEMRTGESSLH